MEAGTNERAPRRVGPVLAGLVLVAAAAEAARAGDERFAVSGETVYRVEISVGLDEFEATLEGGGTVDVEIGIAGVPRTGDGPFDLTALGLFNRSWLPAPPLDAASGFTTVLRVEYSGGTDARTVIYRFGPDTLRLTLGAVGNLAGICGPNDVDATWPRVEINNFEFAIDPIDTMRDAADVMATPGPAKAAFDELVDPDRFWNAVLGASVLIDDLRRGAIPVLEKSQVADHCTLPCTSCAGATMAAVGSTGLLIGACGSSAASGGLTVPVCVASLLVHEGAMINAAAQCTECFVCVDRQRRRSRYCDCEWPEIPERCRKVCQTNPDGDGESPGDDDDDDGDGFPDPKRATVRASSPE